MIRTAILLFILSLIPSCYQSTRLQGDEEIVQASVSKTEQLFEAFDKLHSATCACAYFEVDDDICYDSFPMDIQCAKKALENRGEAVDSLIDCWIELVIELSNCIEDAKCKPDALLECERYIGSTTEMGDRCGQFPDNIDEKLDPCEHPFLCSNGDYVSEYNVCDGFEDCSDGTDEIDCGTRF